MTQKTLRNVLIIALLGSLIPLSSFAGTRRSVGSGLVTGVGAGVASGDVGTGLAVGGATTGVGLLSGCAPGELEENLVSTETALRRLSREPAFQDADLFQAELDRISRLNNPQERAARLFQLAGVNPSSEKAIVQFLSERDYATSHYARNVKANLELNNEQAIEMLEELSGSIAGGLK